MGSILQTTLNTRALPTGDMRYVRSDYPGKLTDEEVQWLLQRDITTIVDLREIAYLWDLLAFSRQKSDAILEAEKKCF